MTARAPIEPATADGHAADAATLAPARRLRAIALSPTFLSLIDQAVVSAATFLVVVLIGRLAGLEELGLWALAASLVAMAVATQDALVTRPYTVTRLRAERSPQAHAFAALAGTAGLGLLAAAAALCGAAMLLAFGAANGSATIAGALALAVPAVLMREFARRHAFAELAIARALAIDVAASALLLATTLALALAGVLSAASALLGLALATGITAAWWLSRRRIDFDPDISAAKAATGEFLKLGRWFMVSAGAVQVQGYGVHWMTFAFLGAAETGLYAACLSIVAFANPFVFGFLNLLTPRCVETLRHAGLSGLRRRALADMLVVGAVLGVFALAVWLVGGYALWLLYDDAAIAEGVTVLYVLALGVFAGALGLPASAALSSLERARLLAHINLAVAAATVIFVFVGIQNAGLVGGACGLLAGEALSSLARWIAFATVKAADTPALPPHKQTEPETAP